MNERLSHVEGDLSVEKTMEVIERGTSAFVASLDTAATVTEPEEPMKIGYQEQEESEAFFVPYTWEVIHKHTTGDLRWQDAHVAIFSPTEGTEARS